MNEDIPKLNLELKEGQMLNTDMDALKEFLMEISRDDLIDIHNLTVELVNKRIYEIRPCSRNPHE